MPTSRRADAQQLPPETRCTSRPAFRTFALVFVLRHRSSRGAHYRTPSAPAFRPSSDEASRPRGLAFQPLRYGSRRSALRSPQDATRHRGRVTGAQVDACGSCRIVLRNRLSAHRTDRATKPCLESLARFGLRGVPPLFLCVALGTSRLEGKPAKHIHLFQHLACRRSHRSAPTTFQPNAIRSNARFQPQVRSVRAPEVQHAYASGSCQRQVRSIPGLPHALLHEECPIEAG